MAFSTEFQANMAPTYIIYRGEPYDASAPLNFFPAQDSDELFDALRSKYPSLKSHSERTREAVIEFLLEEKAAESFSNSTTPTMPSLYDGSTAATSPSWQQSWPSMSSTTQSTPEMLNMATPNFSNNSPMLSGATNFAPMTRQVSQATESAGTTPPALDQMTSVFALSSSELPKQRIRRKMTEDEKVEYRKRRIVKACEKCSKRKRKCNHNQPEMETLPSAASTAGSKVTKPRTTAQRSSPLAQMQQPKQPSITTFETGSEGLDNDMFSAGSEGFEDFSFLVNDTAPELDLGEMLQQLDAPIAQRSNQQYVQHFPQDMHGSTDRSLLGTPDSNSLGDMGGLMFPDNDLLFDGPLFADDDSQKQALASYGTESQQPTHTAHLHSARSGFGSAQGTFSVGKAELSAVSSGHGAHLQTVPLDQGVLRLTGTTKAKRTSENAIAGLNPSRSSRVRIEHVAKMVGSAVAHAQDTVHTDRFLLDNVPGSASRDSHARDRRQDGVWTTESIPGGTTSRDSSSQPPRPQDTTASADGTMLRASANGTLLRANANGKRPIATANGTSPRANASQQQLASTSALTSRTSPFDSEVPSSNRRSALSAGSSSTSPSAEMFMLKRRIPKALHSIVDCDTNTTKPLLQTNSSSNSRQAKGAAYLRLDADNYTKPSRSVAVADTSTILSAAKKKQDVLPPAHTRPTAPKSTSLSDGGVCAPRAEAAKAKHPRFAVASSKSGCYPQFESDTDTQRHRDHFGRAWPSTSAGDAVARFALGGVMLLAAMLASGVSLSLLLLVLICPQPKGSKSADRTLWSWSSHASMLPIVQCSFENSAWLSGLRSKARGLLGCEGVKQDKATSLWYVRCDGWRLYQDNRQDAGGNLAIGRYAPVEVA